MEIDASLKRLQFQQLVGFGVADIWEAQRLEARRLFPFFSPIGEAFPSTEEDIFVSDSESGSPPPKSGRLPTYFNLREFANGGRRLSIERENEEANSANDLQSIAESEVQEEHSTEECFSSRFHRRLKKFKFLVDILSNLFSIAKKIGSCTSCFF